MFICTLSITYTSPNSLQCLVFIYISLVDIVGQAVITFEVQYYSPDGTVGSWNREDFTYPLVDFGSGDGEEDRASQLGLIGLETGSLLVGSE